MKLSKYEEAQKAYITYIDSGGSLPAVLQEKRRCDEIIKIINQEKQYVVRNEKGINTEFNDCATAMTKDVLVFSSDRSYSIKNDAKMSAEMKKFLTYFNDIAPTTVFSEYDRIDISRLSPELQKAMKQDNFKTTEHNTISDGIANGVNLFVTSSANYPQWAKAEICPLPLTLYRNSGTACFAANGNTMYLSYKNNDGKFVLKASHKVKGQLQWLDPIPVLFPSSKFNKATFLSQYVSEDGKVLIFAAENAPGSFGGFDLYISRLEADGKWGEPANLGPLINTKGDELFPSLDTEGNLYFSSTGHIGLGGADIFRANGILNHWHSVENMGAPINSAGDDYALMFYPHSSTSGMFTSNRPGGMGKDDIYSFDKIKSTSFAKRGIIAVKVVNKANKSPIINADVSLVTSKRITYTATTSINGEVFFAVLPNENYVLSATSIGNFAPMLKINGRYVKKDGTFKVVVEMSPIKVKKPASTPPKSNPKPKGK
ncbi:hypothetical protein FACS189452_05480 [Bacteroidia bacterium]|nr:hypothetical protein FACS189452_05480 [Bacteroidia bacterium]